MPHIRRAEISRRPNRRHESFANFRDCFIQDGKTLGECLKRAAVAMVREFSVQHVERNGFRNGLGSRREDECCFGIR